jgi:general secretion pathway protein K
VHSPAALRSAARGRPPGGGLGGASAPAPPSRRVGRAPGAPRGDERGAALLFVLLTVAQLTAITVEIAYQTRVSLQLAVNARDELRATAQARGAVALSRLVLHFQQRLDAASGAASRVLTSSLPGAAAAGATSPPAGAATAGTPAASAQSAPSFSFRLWEVIPVDSATTAMLLGSPSREPLAEPGAKGEGAAARPPDGGPSGSFHARIDDEDRKVNVSQLAGLTAVAGPQLQRLLLAARDPRYDVLFDREDANGNRFSRKDVAAAFKDWVDEDATASAVTSNPAVPFEDAFADENLAYDRGEDRYKAKNARFDSLDELYLVAGVSDAFMAAFGDQLTVYPDVNAPTNINTADPEQLMVNVLLMADPPGVPQPVVLDPSFPQKLSLALRLARPLPFMTLTVQQFATILQSLGVRVQPLFLQAANTDARNPFGNRSSTFTIRATGRAGQVEKTIDAVVTLDDRAGGLSGDLGRLLHWREE